MSKKKAQTEAVGFKELYEKGKLNYILKYGVLSWGISLAIIVRVLISFAKYKFKLQLVAKSLFSLDTVIALIMFSFFGWIWGRIMWGFLEKEVQKQENKKSKKGDNRKHKK